MKYNFTHLLANGCSHTAGSEILQSAFGDGYECRENCFSATLAKKLKVQYSNIAMPGASNDYIYRTTFFWILENYELAKKTLFLINWTGEARGEYFYAEKDDDPGYWDFLSYPTFDKSVGHLHPGHYGHMPTSQRPIVRLLTKSMFMNPVHVNINRYLNVIYLQEYLKSNNLQYIFRNAYSFCASGKRYKKYIKLIDTKNFLGCWNIEESFYEHCLQQGYSIEGQAYAHHKKEAHDYWAEKLFKDHF